MDVLLSPIIAGLPLACLAPLIIQGAIGVINLHELQVAWAASPSEFFVMLATFAVPLIMAIKHGVLVGFVLSMLKTMYDL